MNFKDQIQQIFGTTDIHELKQISRDADNYRCLNADMNNSIISEKKKNTGRKNSFTEEQLAHILALQDRGEKITDIARQYHVSRQTIYSQIKRAYNFSDDPDWADFEYFLEERCFPRTRDHRKDILREMGLPFYDPLLIIEKTQGRMSDDHQWIMILKKEG